MDPHSCELWPPRSPGDHRRGAPLRRATGGEPCEGCFVFAIIDDLNVISFLYAFLAAGFRYGSIAPLYKTAQRRSLIKEGGVTAPEGLRRSSRRAAAVGATGAWAEMATDLISLPNTCTRVQPTTKQTFVCCRTLPNTTVKSLPNTPGTPNAAPNTRSPEHAFSKGRTRVCICMYACLHVCMYACMNACVHVRMCACVHVCSCACVHTSI